jgi:hypothetical protein
VVLRRAVWPQVLQMVGRAGRPQFDTHGVAVIMTSRDSTHRYQRLLAGQVSWQHAQQDVLFLHAVCVGAPAFSALIFTADACP